jgi:OOP family OmpA-OmpF porin
MNKRLAISAVLSVLCVLPLLVAAQEDEAGCKDHPLLSRMKGFAIYECDASFDAVEFYLSEEETKTVEGQKTFLSYTLREGEAKPSELQILRNYENALKAAGGTVLYRSPNYLAGRIAKGQGEIWVAVKTSNYGGDYTLTILEVGEMVQEVTAGDMLAALNKDGRIALSILFDTGKATIRPESERIVGEIAVLLRENPDLMVSVEGHTDNTGTAQGNKALSEERAKAVRAAVAALGVEAGRLSAVGWGQDKPVADNATEEGRARNRRVEIVKK